jgi:glycosyltransferase involved in cell wall biosynthesis
LNPARAIPPDRSDTTERGRTVRALWVTNEPPDRHGGGGNIRQSQLLTALARRHEVDLLMVGTEPDAQTREAVRRITRIEPRPGPALGPVTRRIKALRLALGAGPTELFDGRAAREALSRSWPAESYDLVLIEHAAMAPLITHKRPGEVWVCGMQFVGSGTVRSLLDLTTGRRQRWALTREVRYAEQLERQVLQDYDLVFTVSQEDAAMLDGPSVVVPNGVDLSAFTTTPVPEHEHLLFTGTLSYLPNVDGLEWFCSQVLPRVRKQLPGLVMDVVGRDPVPRVRALADVPGVHLHVNVPQVQPFIQNARACVVPLRIGTGSRLKALEAMASGRPVIGTTVGLAGLELTDQALVADDPAELAAHIVAVLTDHALAQRLAAAGRQHVEESFGWEALGRRFVGELERLSPPR